MTTSNTNYHKQFGNSGEARVVELLSARGFVILEKNFRYGKLGEIDIIAQKDDLVLFIEVKTRSNASFGGALYSITPSKKKKLSKVANYFLTLHPAYNDVKYIHRFDLIALEDDEVKWVEDIIR